MKNNKRHILWVLVLILFGCGDGTVPSSMPSEELDGIQSQEADISGTLNVNPYTQEIAVNLLQHDPIMSVDQLILQESETIKIKLHTLAYLPNETAYPLVAANQLIHRGMPKVVGPQNYAVRLGIQGNQLVAYIKTTVSPEKAPILASFDPQDDDIIVGNLTAEHAYADLSLGRYRHQGWGMRRSLDGRQRALAYDTDQHHHLEINVLNAAEQSYLNVLLDAYLLSWLGGDLSVQWRGSYAPTSCATQTFVGLKNQWNIHQGISLLISLLAPVSHLQQGAFGVAICYDHFQLNAAANQTAYTVGMMFNRSF